MASRRRSVLLPFALVSAIAGLFGSQAIAASGPALNQGSIPASVPATGTPQAQNGTVYGLAKVGSTMVVGGTFTSVKSPDLKTTYTRNRIFAFDVSSGAVSTAFNPNFNGEVDVLLPGPTAGTVYVGGKFTTMGGTSVPGIVVLNVSNGSRVATFAPPSVKNVQTIARNNGQLIIGGTFTKVGSTKQVALASLDPTTGAKTSYVGNFSIAGHHNYGNVPPEELNAFPPFPGAPVTKVSKGAVQVQRVAVNPAGTRMVAIGNFTSVGGQAHDQIAMFNLSGGGVTLDTSWTTKWYTANCFFFIFDSYMRDVDFSPDGSYFTVAAAGGHDLLKPINTVACDTISRFETNGSGSDVKPTWAQFSGSDSFLSVMNTGTMVLGAGHPRFANNPYGSDSAGPGAIARPSIQALDPVNGMPLAWDPGREPRGHGIEALLATSDGIWMGSDTEYWGNHEYQRNRLAFFPLSGGYVPASTATSIAKLYVGSGSTLSRSDFGGSAPGAASPVGSSGPNWSTVHGAVSIGGTVFYGASDNMLHSRTFNGTTWGSDKVLNPYDNPRWNNVVDDGRGTSGATLHGVAPDFYSASQLGKVTSMAFNSANGRMYYTLAGDSSLYYRAFSPDSGVIYPIATKVAAPNMSQTTGAAIDNGTLYFVTNGTTLSKASGSGDGFSASSSVVGAGSFSGTVFTAGS